MSIIYAQVNKTWAFPLARQRFLERDVLGVIVLGSTVLA
jgi:hypothetical protein